MAILTDEGPGRTGKAVPAGFWRRASATVVDAAVMAAGFFILGLVLVLVATATSGGLPDQEPGWLGPATTASWAVGMVAYFSLLNGLGRGQTIGKMVAGIAVRDETTGGAIGIWRALGRFLLRAVLYCLLVLPGVVGDLVAVWDTGRQSLADKVVGSRVVLDTDTAPEPWPGPPSALLEVGEASVLTPTDLVPVGPIGSAPQSPQASGGRRHWWSAMPAESSPPIPAHRAYLEILGVFALFFGAPIGLAAASLAGDLPSRTRSGWALAGPGAYQEFATAVLAVGAVVILSGRRGRSRSSLGFCPARGPYRSPIGVTIRSAAWATMALLAGGAITSTLSSGVNDFHVANGADMVFGAAASINAGFLEEGVVLAFLVATLEQARRPLVEILAVGVLLRASYHIYYGPGVVGILVWASMFIWIYRRTRSVYALIGVHIVWDLLVTLHQLYPPVTTVLGTLIPVLLLIAPITWAVDRARRPPQNGVPAMRPA